MLDKRLIQKNQERLEKEKKRLEGLLSHIAKRDQKGGDFHAKYPEFGNKEDENASEVAVYEVNIAEEYDFMQKLRKVEAALERIKKGTYGLCLEGREEMSVERLEAVPEAENCVEHESK